MAAIAIWTDLQPILAELRRGLEAIYGDRLVRLVLFGSRRAAMPGLIPTSTFWWS